MKQVIQSRRTGKLVLKEVPDPIVKAGNLLVRTRASLVSVGTERMAINFARKSIPGKAASRPDLIKKIVKKAKKDGLKSTFKSVMARLDEPLPLGYSATGEITALGAGLEGQFKVGERVAIAGAGIANHAELNIVPASLAATVPEDVTDEEASFGTLGAIALHAVRNLKTELGDTIGIIGMGLIGQLAAQLLTLSGARVIAMDYDQSRLDIAKMLGAEFLVKLSVGDHSSQVNTLIGENGCDAILIAAATSSNEPFQTAADIARDRARITMVGMTGTEFPYAEFMKKELNIIVSRSYGPGRYDSEFENKGIKYPTGWVRWTETENLRECIRLMGSGTAKKLLITPLITHRFPIEDADKAYAMIMNRSEPQLGVVLTYRKKISKNQISTFKFSAPNLNRLCILGVIGAGNFAKTVLIPGLKNNNNVRFHTIVTQRGASANHSQETFGFENSATDPKSVISNPEINAVLIATRHNTHADLTTQALNARKNVFVEKPLALDHEGINNVIIARNKLKNAFFQVGFNRRFAPMAVQVQEELKKIVAPKFMVFRINAGQIKSDHWVYDPDEGGGRIIGEVCHFVDLARFFACAPITSIHSEATSEGGIPCNNIVASISFADGSLATILYTSQGDDTQGKEKYEIFSAGKNIKIDDFRKLEISQNGKVSLTKKSQNKGFQFALNAYVQAIINQSDAPINEAELIESSLGTIAILESIKSGKRITF